MPEDSIEDVMYTLVGTLHYNFRSEDNANTLAKEVEEFIEKRWRELEGEITVSYDLSPGSDGIAFNIERTELS